jgi:phosphoribosyl 1,2-cyclic phosphodiesterase
MPSKEKPRIKVRFWGTSGSIPTALPIQELEEKIIQALLLSKDHSLTEYEEARQFVRTLPFLIRGTYYGNSSCVEVLNPDGPIIILDAGSGLRQAGLDIIKRPEFQKGDKTIHLFLSHLHWDHIQGFPFFTPAYFPNVTIRLYGFHPDLEKAFQNQQQDVHFPVPLQFLPARLEFITLQPGEPLRIGSVEVQGRPQNHPGHSFAYQINISGKRFVYASDAEYQKEELDHPKPILDFFHQADLVVFDAQYTLVENILDKMNWGHSNVLVGIELATDAQVKKIAFTHHEPTYNDSFKEAVLNKALEYTQLYRHGNSLEIVLAYDGLELEL